MRGVAAYSNDFYFGTSSASTDNQANSGAEPANGASAAGPNSGVTMAGSLTGGAPSSAKSAINPVNLVPGLQGVNPLWAIPIILGVLVLFKIVRELGHKSSDFAPLKVDLYWFAMTALASTAGIPLIKAIANKYPIQPITDYINNA